MDPAQRGEQKAVVQRLAPRGESLVAPEPAARSHSVEEEELIFRLQVKIDLQKERVLLFRSMIVLEAIAALMIVRHWALWLFS